MQCLLKDDRFLDFYGHFDIKNRLRKTYESISVKSNINNITNKYTRSKNLKYSGRTGSNCANVCNFFADNIIDNQVDLNIDNLASLSTTKAKRVGFRLH